MIGQRIEGPPERAWPWGICFGLALLLIAGGSLSQQLIWTVLAILPITVGTALWMLHRRQFVAEITEEGLQIDHPLLLIPYSQMRGIFPLGRLQSPCFAIRLRHEEGVVDIPAELNVASRELHDFLHGRSPPQDHQPLPPGLEEYPQRHEAQFGADRVVCYRVRKSFGHISRHWRAVGVCLAFMITGLAWLGIGSALGGEDFAPLAVFGFLFALFGFLFAIGFYVKRVGRRLAKWRESGIVLSPVGLAMIQGGLRGELGWHEIIRINYPHKSGALSYSTSNERGGIGLVVEGATIVVVDIYDQSLPVIDEQLRAHWGGN